MPTPVGMKPTCLNVFAIDHVHAVGHHVGDVEAACRRARHARLAACPVSVQIVAGRSGWGQECFVGFLPGFPMAASASGRSKYWLSLIVSTTVRLTRSILRDAAVELAGEQRVLAVDREIGVVDAFALGRRRLRTRRAHRLGVAEVQPLERFGNDDRRTCRRATSTCCTGRRPGSSCPACRSWGRSMSRCRRADLRHCWRPRACADPTTARHAADGCRP